MVDEQRLQVRVAVVFTRLMMKVAFIEGRKLFQPFIDVVDKPLFIVVDIHAGSDVHGRNQDHAILHATVAHDLLHLWSDMHIFAMPLGIERQVFSLKFHETSKFVTILQLPE